MNNEKIITMEKYGDTYEIYIRHLYLEMHINGSYQGGIRTVGTNIYEWIMNNIQSWLDNKAYLESKVDSIEDLF